MEEAAVGGAKALIESGVLGCIVAIQMGVIIWLVKKVLEGVDKTNAAIASLNQAIQNNTLAVKGLVEMLRDRPCLEDDRAFRKEVV